MILNDLKPTGAEKQLEKVISNRLQELKSKYYEPDQEQSRDSTGGASQPASLSLATGRKLRPMSMKKFQKIRRQ